MSDDKKLEEKEYIDSDREEDEKKHWPAFMLLGFSIGGGLGILFKNIAIGSGLGLIFGVLVGIFIDNINAHN
jgi:hypothetical protein